MDAPKKVKPFTVAWKNPKEPLPSNGRGLVKCEVCGKLGLPFGEWFCYELPIKSKLYEFAFWLCGEKCGNVENLKALMTKKQKELS